MIKQDIIQRALEEIGIATYIYDLSYDELNSCLRRMDSMVSMWGSRGIFIGYPLHQNAEDSSLNDEIDFPLSIFDCVAYNLAVNLSGGNFGKKIEPETSYKAEIAFENLRGRSISPMEIRVDPMKTPSGQGNNWYGYYGDYGTNSFFYNMKPYISLGGSSLIDFY